MNEGSRARTSCVGPCLLFLKDVDLFNRPDGLQAIRDKVIAGERLTPEEGLRLFQTKDLNALASMADFANRRRNGRKASYILNRYINYSNYCILSCQFCAFSRKKRDNDGFQLTEEQMVSKAREALAVGRGQPTRGVEPHTQI